MKEMCLKILFDDHPSLDCICFVSEFPKGLEHHPTPASVLQYFGPDSSAPLSRSEEVRGAVRDLLRHGGFKPTGRSKPASEYLIKAVEKGWFTPEKGINLAVDACNVVSLHSGLPISVIDLHKTEGELSIKLCEPGTDYVFNPTGQTIDISGLISLHDGQGPCAGPVKDSQRTKTHEGTTNTLSIIWGTKALTGRTQAAFNWYHSLLGSCGITASAL